MNPMLPPFAASSSSGVRHTPGRHIVLISTQRAWHGGETQLLLLAKGLQGRGDTTCTIVARKDGAFLPRLSAEGFPTFSLDGSGRNPQSLFSLRRYLQQHPPDVIHANDSHALTVSGLSTFLWRGATPIGLPSPLRVVARRVDFPLRSVWRYRHWADGIICVSSAVRSICAHAGLPERQLQVVHDGVDPTWATEGDRSRGRLSLRMEPDQPLLLTVAKLTDHKGHRYLLEAMAQLVKKFPTLRLALAGDGELRSELEKLTMELGLVSHVQFLGYRHDVPDLLAAADVVVQPSHMEGLCSSLIDAMLAQRPIVATRAGGIPDLLGHTPGEASVGQLVSCRSPMELATAIENSLRNPAQAANWGQAARQRALQHFTAQQMIKKTLAAYAYFALARWGKTLATARLAQAADRESCQGFDADSLVA